MTTTERPPGSDVGTIEGWERGGAYTSFRGHRVFYRREGSGPSLLCIHGYPTASWDFYKVWPELIARFDVIAPDMLGYGYTDKPRGHRYRVVEQAELHLALLESLGVRETHVLCHDYGVSVGQELLARHAEGQTPTLRSITFLNGGLLPEMHRPRLIQRLLASPIGPLVSELAGPTRFQRSLAAVFGPRSQPSQAELDQLYTLVERDGGKRAIAGLIAYMAERREQAHRWGPAFFGTSVPLRVINGVHDPVSGGHLADELERRQPGIDVVRLDVGHYPQLEDPSGVLEAFLEFTERVDRGE